MKPEQHGNTGDSQSNRQRGNVHLPESRVRYQKQTEYSTEGESSSPPPHSSTTTTATTTTPTSEASCGSPRPSSSGSSGSARVSKTGISSAIGPHFPQPGSPSLTHGHRGPTRAPAQGGMSTVDETQWTDEIPANDVVGTQHTTVDTDASQSTSLPLDESSFTSAIKMLVSNNMAGSIIGRSGQTISDLQNQSSTRIKLSQTGVYFPGTQDRVCLVQGHLESVKRAMSLLLTRIYSLQHQNHLQNVAQRQEQQYNDPRATPENMLGVLEPQAFSFVVRILVPTTSCGMIIGKGGSNIKQMVEATGVSSVRLSPKEGVDLNTDASDPTAAFVSATAERIVTISGPDLNCCLDCLFIILDGMTSHPDICRYSNMTTSYSRVISAAYEAASGRAVMSIPSQDSIPRGMTPTGLWDPSYVHPSHQDLGMDLHTPASSEGPPVSPSIAYRRSMSGPSALQSGFTHSPSSPHLFRGQEPVPPYSPMFGGPAAFVPPSPEYPHSPVRGLIPRSHSNASLPFGPMGLEGARPPSVSISAPDLLALQFQESLRMSDPHRIEPPLRMYCGPQQQGFTVQVAIPDSLIGSILGRGGQTMNELQMQSNTRIRISQRGEYVPGTKNRIVTIQGPTAQSVTMAQMLMSQRMVLPPTAVSPPTAFPIQPVEPSYEHEPHRQGGYIAQSPSIGPRPPATSDSQEDTQTQHRSAS